MQIANILLALAGDTGNSIPKFSVTPAEVAVLQVIHGNDAVSEIDIVGDVKRTSREERARLVELYRKGQPDGTYRAPAVDMLFPGVATRVFEAFEEIEDLDESQFKVKQTQAAKPAARPVAQPTEQPAPEAAEPEVVKGIDEMTKVELVAFAKANNIDIDPQNSKADVLDKIRGAIETAPEPDEEDGIDDMDDGKNLFE